MRKLLPVIILSGLMLAVSACSSLSLRNTVIQTSTIDALLAGAYDGNMSCAQLLKHGNLGIGTFDRLDGEMVLLDGRVDQVCKRRRPL